MKSLTILMTGAGAPGAPGIIRSYRYITDRTVRIIGVDAKATVPTVNMLDGFEQIPMASDPSFLSAILAIAKKYKADVIQPLVTRELEIFAENVDMFSDAGIAVCVSPKDNLTIANDKGKLLDKLSSMGVYVPKFSIVENIDDFKAACTRLGYPENPVCFKPTKANGSRGFRILDRSVDRANVLFNQKPTSVYASYEEIVDILKSNDFPELVVMEYLPGKEYSVDMLVDNGRVIYAIPRLRQTMNGGISTDCVVVEDVDVIEYASEIACKLKLHGNIGVQVRRNVSGNPGILEINPRVQGSIVCCSAAGVNLPYYGIKLALKETIPQVPVKWGTRMVRHWSECFYDISGQSYTY